MTRIAGLNSLLGYYSWRDMTGQVVVLGAQYRSGMVVADPAGMRGTRFLCRFCKPTVMWSAISRGGRDFTPRHVWYRDTLIHLISGASGASQFQAAVIAEMRV